MAKIQRIPTYQPMRYYPLVVIASGIVYRLRWVWRFASASVAMAIRGRASIRADELMQTEAIIPELARPPAPGGSAPSELMGREDQP